MMRSNMPELNLLRIFTLFSSIILLAFVDAVQAQFTPDGDIHAVVRADGRAFIYHGEEIPLSHGFNVYRKIEDAEWVLLTDEPIYPVINGYEFERQLGETYSLLSDLLNTDSPQSAFLRLRSNSQTGLLASFTMPEVAQAVGRLYIDEEAPLGQTASYRFEIVDDLERPIGQVIEGRAALNPLYPPAPENPEIEHEGSRVTARWSYVPATNQDSRNVIRFQIFYETEENGPVKAHTSFIARTDQQTDYLYSFDVPETDIEYTFSIHAIDFTGQLSEPSERITVAITNNIAPDRIANVRAESTDDHLAFVTWPVSPSLRLEGYNIYRARNDEEVYAQINETLMEPLQTVFVDSTVEPGTQYRYSITAVDSLGNESERSNPAHVLIIDYRIPDPVSVFESRIMQDGAVSLNWNTTEVPAGLRNYLLLRRQIQPQSGISFTQVNSGPLTDTTFVDRGIGGQFFTEGATYEYGISVASNNGSYSDTVYTEITIPDITPPEPPTLFRLAMEDGQRVGITWNASEDTDVTEYVLYRNHIESGRDTLLSAFSTGTRYFRDEMVRIGESYEYRISAVDSLGNQSEFRSDSITTQLKHPPAPVRNVQVAYMNNSVKVVWEDSDSGQVAGYKIYKAEVATGIFEYVGEVAADSREFIDEEGNAGFWYKVFPVDSSGREARTAKATQAIEIASRAF
ncbi:fibronectin type III domain-containing protein [Rhodohalobacter mucosus]|uniref:Fibronectin type-III domain-containing protein n=1 Tax=Rhodohalobacter mucosus TaxID=2079485 RepID=A0A316TUT7_9BACT|nr:hypothetical protein [Rhodohalobacter mucosus]PWN07628.1 hypothetical protein DDZ15_05065 [Rhodohalobacter mucosus]